MFVQRVGYAGEGDYRMNWEDVVRLQHRTEQLEKELKELDLAGKTTKDKEVRLKLAELDSNLEILELALDLPVGA